MTSTRTIKDTITFKNPFHLDNNDELFPPGRYEVETHEERIEGLSFTAYQRIRTIISIREPERRPVCRRQLTIDPTKLSQAIQRDGEIEASRNHALKNTNPL